MFEREYWQSGQTQAGSILLNDHLSIALIFGWPTVILWLVAIGCWFVATLRNGSTGLAEAGIACLLPTSFANNVIFNPLLAPVWWGFFIRAMARSTHEVSGCVEPKAKQPTSFHTPDMESVSTFAEDRNI